MIVVKCTRYYGSMFTIRVFTDDLFPKVTIDFLEELFCIPRIYALPLATFIDAKLTRLL